jgi:hypothetical protein
VAKAGKKKPRVSKPSQDVARAMGMSPEEATTLERLLSLDALEREKNPEEPGGDDIGVEVESKEEPEDNEAEVKMYKRLHSWLREAVWQHRVSKDEEHLPAAVQQQQQQDWFRPSSKASAKSSYGAAFAASKGFEWTPYEEEIAQMLKAPLPRAAFVRLLQMQVMYAAGLQTPLKGARGVQLQLQPLLGMGVSDAILARGSFTSSSHLVSSSSQSFKTLLVLSLPPQCFGRLVSMMAALVEEAATLSLPARDGEAEGEDGAEAEDCAVVVAQGVGDAVPPAVTDASAVPVVAAEREADVAAAANKARAAVAEQAKLVEQASAAWAAAVMDLGAM